MSNEPSPVYPPRRKIWHAYSRNRDGIEKFFKVFDSLSIATNQRKIRFEIFQRNINTKQHQSVSHSLNWDAFLLLAGLVRSGRLGCTDNIKNKDVPPTGRPPYQEYKGTPDRKGKYSTGQEARMFKMDRVPSSSNPFLSSFFVTIENGPGEPTSNGTGAVKFANNAPGKVSLGFVLTEEQALTMVEVVNQYILCWTIANFPAVQSSIEEHFDKESPVQNEQLEPDVPADYPTDFEDM